MSSTTSTSIAHENSSFDHAQNLEHQRQKQNGNFTNHENVSFNKTVVKHHVINLANACRATEAAYPLILSFNKLSYSVKVHQKLAFSFLGRGRRGSQERNNNKVLLDNISGEAREGEIMAILGASGSGKSTLIDALAGRIGKESLKGTISLNGEVLESRLLKVISAYVMQDDLLFPMLTVQETLMFSAEFKLPRYFTKKMKQARIQALIDQLGLRTAGNTIIGDEKHRGISGGERRRVSIGVDIVHDPILLFLDEPISGLDSTSAFMIVKVLKRIAKSGSIVIMSIHQPSYRILSLLDRSVFLSRGQTVYSGALAGLSHFFSNFGHPVPENGNETEFALDLIRELEEIPGGITSLVNFNKAWQTLMKHANKVDDQPKVSLKYAMKTSIAKGKLVSAGTSTNNSNQTSSVQTFANPFWIEIIVISKRLLINSRRMPELFKIRLGVVFFTAFVLGTLYWRLSNSPQGTEGRLGFLASAMTTILYICAHEIPAYHQERYIFIRETAYNAYRHSSYVLAHSLVSIPSMIILSSAFSASTFWAVGLAGGFSGFFFFFITIFTTFWAGSSFMAFFSGLVTNLIVGFTSVAAILGYFLIFSGFYISPRQIPFYWKWLHYVSLVKYPYEAVLQNEYSDTRKCFAKGIQLFDNTPFVELTVATKMKLLESMSSVLSKDKLSSSTCLSTGVQILKQIGASDFNKWNCILITIAFGILFRVLFFLSLLFGSKNKRR
ncbi:hypothetical protein Pint_35518 [Pistacia integerrima]|uniref:Uncharacterized protein n=1 Tax=Pistacia integerrima TaxID=434235 RepID=A0ACC0Y395_9ROSI|nr:hypothetical protein Pint_35518 [Pistacia integerrima]